MTPLCLPSPSSLKGIVSTNDNPGACAFCCVPFPVIIIVTKSCYSYCCGKRICLVCKSAGRAAIRSGNTNRCAFCNASFPYSSSNDGIGRLKKHAKKGATWAQYLLGRCYELGEYVTKSDYEAKRWYEKAARQGHPLAMFGVAEFYKEGCGGYSIDLVKARQLAEKITSMSVDLGLTNACRALLIEIADEYVKLQTTVATNEAMSILMPLAEDGVAIAQKKVGLSFRNTSDFLSAKHWFAAAALQGDKDAALKAFRCCVKTGETVPEAKFWFDIFSKTEIMLDDSERMTIKEIGRIFRQIRNICGECCNMIEGDRRLYCRQCKTYCYCSRACQKLHWNRVGARGHAKECKDVQRLKEKMKMAHPDRGILPS